MVNTTSTPVNPACVATLPITLAAGIAPDQSACLNCICTSAEQAALDAWLSACPVSIVHKTTPFPHFVTQAVMDEHEARKRDAIAALLAKGGAE